MKHVFSTDNLERVFAKPENDYEGFKQFLYDYTHGRDVFDEDGNKVTSAQANAKINAVCFDILGLDSECKTYTKRDIHRAMKKHGMELFEVTEEVIDFKVTTGFEDNEFFQQFVEYKSLKQGDRNEFYTEKDVVLSVAKVSGDHHDLSLQKLGEGETFSVQTYNYAVKIGMDIDVYLLGRKDWSKLVDQVARAYAIEFQNDIFAEFTNAAQKLPNNEQFNVSKELTPANKARFDELLSDVSSANGGVGVTIFGLATDLKKLSALTDISWISDSQKEEVAKTGRLGTYEGTPLVEIPQRFALNDVTKKLIETGHLYIMPNVEDKFVKFYDVGETEIVEVTEKGQRRDDFQTYEAQREAGVTTIIDKYHGEWNIQ